MAGKTVLVTGGMGGLGESICTKLAEQGYRVVTTHSPGNAKAAEWLAQMKQQGYDFRAYPCDVGEYDSCVECVAKVTADVGPIDVLINNAPWIIFERDLHLFQARHPEWRLESIHPIMPVAYLLSGGVSMRNLLPGWMYRPLRLLEQYFNKPSWAMFAMISLTRQG